MLKSLASTIKKSPFLWTNAILMAVLCAALAKPLFMDGVAKRLPTASSSYVTSNLGFSLSGFLSQLEGFMKIFGDWLNPFVESTVASFEKDNVAEKEQTQGALNYKAAKEAAAVAAEAQDLYGPETVSSCDILIASAETVDAKNKEGFMAKSLTASNVRRNLNANNSSLLAKELLGDSFGDYCSPESLSRGSCTKGLSPKNMPDADILAKTIMSTDDGLSQTLSKDELDAASKYVTWSTNPVPEEVLPIALERTPAGQRYAIEKRRREAITSAAQYSLNRIISSRSEKL